LSEESQVTQRNTGCPEPKLLAARAEGRLAGREAARLDEHIAGCADCYEVFSETIRFTLAERETGEEAPDTPSLWRRSRLELVVGFAVAALVLVAIPYSVLWAPDRGSPRGLLREVPGVDVAQMSSRSSVSLALEDLARALGPRRLVEPRLSGGFQYGRLERFRSPDVPRGLDAQPPAVLAAVARIRELAGNDSSPQALRALGLTYLVSGDTNAAVEALEDATAQSPDDPRFLSDLAAAYLARAAQLDEAADIPRGLEAAEQAIALPDAPVEAWFNRALALESLHLRDAARSAWRDYLERDTGSGWAQEAQEHLAGLPEARLPSAEEDAARVRAALADGRVATERLGEEAPQLLRVYLQDELLPAWAEAYLAGHPDADLHVERARVIGDVLERTIDDALPRDAAHALETSAASLRSQAHGYRALRDATALYEAQRPSCSAFRGAQRDLEAGGSPYQAWARLQSVIACASLAEPEVALPELSRLESFAESRGYPQLLGRIRWMQGLVHGRRGEFTTAMERYRLARSAFHALHDVEGEAVMLGMLAENLHLLGEQRNAWADRQRALGLLAAIGDPRRQQGILSEALLASLDGPMPRCGVHFGTALVEAAASWQNPMAVSAALTRRAAVRQLLGLDELAASDVNAARQWVSRLPDGSWAAQVRAEADAVEGAILSKRQPAEAAQSFERALAYFRTAAPFRVPALHLLLARAHAARGSDTEAEAELLAGIEAMERGRIPLGDAARQVSFFDQALPLFDDMVQLQITKRQDPERALAFVERGHARQLADALGGGGVTPYDPETLRKELPEGLALVYYLPLPGGLYAWSLSGEGLHFIERPLPANELSQLVAAHRTAIERRAPLSVVRRAAARLYDELVRPFIPTLASQRALVFVADGVLQSAAFAALWNAETGRYLVEDYLLGVAPSGTVFVRASSRATSPSAPSALVVGNPRVDRSVRVGLKDLPDAETEAMEVAQLYSRSEVLSGAAATKTAFLEGIRIHNVVHFAGHAAARAGHPSSARLLLSADPALGDSGALYLHDLEEVTLPRARVVVLAACRTGAGTVSRVEGALSLSRPFLAAGVPDVVASLWDIDDAVSHRFFISFHRALLERGSPESALRETQLALLRGNDVWLSHPASWAAFICMGGLDPHSLSEVRS